VSFLITALCLSVLIFEKPFLYIFGQPLFCVSIISCDEEQLNKPTARKYRRRNNFKNFDVFID
jgi:hypothetical protein